MIHLTFANILVDTFFHGGIIMWPLLALSLFALAVIAERIFWGLSFRRTRDTERLNRIYKTLGQGDRDEAIKLADASADPRVRVVAYALDHPETAIEIATQIRSSEELKIARRFLTAMDTIITLAPLLGLLGTVTGIMQSFKFVGGDQDLAVSKVSGGIGEALIATACGLGIAIVTLLPFNIFGSKAEELEEELETVSKNVQLLSEKAKSRSERGYELADASK